MRTVRGIWVVVGIVFFVLGLPSTRGDVAGWASWLDWLRDAPWQWLFIGIGLAIITLAEGPALHRRYARRALAPAAASTAPAAAPPAAPMPEPLIASRDAVWAEQTRRQRVANLVAARLLLTREFRKAFDDYIETLLERRGELHAGTADERLHELREEYRVLQRLVAATYRRVREHYRRFIEAEPDYDRRHEMFHPPEPGLPLDYPLTQWWKPITFDEAVNNWANADDAHIGHYLDREHAVLDTFEDWLTQADNHPLTDDIEGADHEDEEILTLIRRRQEAQEVERDLAERDNGATRGPVAVLDARPGPVSGGQHFDTYDFEVINTGRAAARNVQAWIANQMDEVVSATVDLHVVPVDNRWYGIKIEVRRVMSRAGGRHLVLKWTDDAGEHRAHALDIAAVLPPVPN